jgi:hypothetical protein
MRKLALTFALTGAALALPLVPAQAGAIRPAALGAAADETNLVETVHCRPGWAHHSSFRFPDGCERRVYRGYYYSPYYAYPPYPYGYYYAPGVTFGFSFGPHRHWHW